MGEEGGLTYHIALTLVEQWGCMERDWTDHSDLVLPHVQMPGAASGMGNLEGRYGLCLAIHCPLVTLIYWPLHELT